MSGIYWSQNGARVKDYSALTKSGKTLLTVKIEVLDHDEIGHMLRQLDEQMAIKPLRGKPPILRITDQRGRSE